MTHIEGSEGNHPSEQPKPPIEIGITPFPDEQAVFRKAPDGGFTIFLRGEIRIAIHPDAVESSVRPSEEQPNGLTPEDTSSPVSEPYSAADAPSTTASETQESGTPENENRKFDLVGNVVYDAKYRVRKSGKRIADFVLATHPDKESTEYWRIRVFNDLAERVRDTVRKGQKDVKATVYGPKKWSQKVKTKEGWEEKEVTGYYAGFVRVPKRYRDESASGKSQDPQKD